MKPAPARVLAERLAAARAQGLSFDAAWPDARKAALRCATYRDARREWACRFDEDKDALWRPAFERRQLAAVGNLSLLGERDTPMLAEMPGGVLAEAMA